MVVVVFYCFDEGEVEFGFVGVVEFGEVGEFFGVVFVNFGVGLFGGVGGGQFVMDCCFVGEVWVGVDQC